MPELDDHNLQAFYAERLVAERHCDETSGIQNTWVFFVFIMSRLVDQTFVLDGWCCVVPYLLVLSKLFFAWTHQLIWKGAVLGSLYKCIISPDNKTVTDSSSLQHLCSMKVWEGIIPSWYGCFRQLDWRDRLQMSCQLQWCRKMITSLSNPQTFPCMLFCKVGQANVKVSRRIADILYGIGNLDIKPQLNSFARIPVNIVPCKHLLHGNYRCFQIFFWGWWEYHPIHPGFFRKKSGRMVMNKDLSFGLGLLSQPGVDGVGEMDVVMWWSAIWRVWPGRVHHPPRPKASQEMARAQWHLQVLMECPELSLFAGK